MCGCVGAGLFEPRNGFDDVWLEAREVPLPDGEKAQSVACSGALTAVLTGVSPLHACTHQCHTWAYDLRAGETDGALLPLGVVWCVVLCVESGRVLCMGMNHMGQCGVGQVSSTVWTPEPGKQQGPHPNKPSRKGLDLK